MSGFVKGTRPPFRTRYFSHSHTIQQDETNKDESTMKFIALALALSTSVRGLDYPIGITNCGVFQRIDGEERSLSCLRY